MIFTQSYSGRSSYSADYVEGPYQLFVAVECLIGDFNVSALLDTASQWCILPAAIASSMPDDLTPDGAPDRLRTRLGTFSGRLVRIPVGFSAEEGDIAEVDATWFASLDWPGPAVVGWKGCLERLRFALDPIEERFYFGEA